MPIPHSSLVKKREEPKPEKNWELKQTEAWLEKILSSPLCELPVKRRIGNGYVDVIKELLSGKGYILTFKPYSEISEDPSSEYYTLMTIDK